MGTHAWRPCVTAVKDVLGASLSKGDNHRRRSVHDQLLDLRRPLVLVGSNNICHPSGETFTSGTDPTLPPRPHHLRLAR